MAFSRRLPLLSLAFTLLLTLLNVLYCPGVAALPRPQEEPADTHWVDLWASMPQLVEPNNLPPSPFTEGSAVFRDATLRQTVYLTLDTSQIRLRISNAFGTSQLPITAVTVALPGNNGAAGVKTIQTGTLKKVTFNGGQASVTLKAGELVVSDPIEMEVKAMTNLAVSIYSKEGQSGNSVTGHPGSRTTSWLAKGNGVEKESLDGTSTVHWYLLSAVEGMKTTDHRAFVIVGDSITDGRGSTDNGNNRWPDLLLARLKKDPATSTIAVINQAAGGNRILADGLGPKAIGRLDRDVIKQAGVGWALIFEGVNDMGGASADSNTQRSIGDQLIAAYKTMSQQLHAAGIPVLGGTITPFGGNGQSYSSPVREQTRQRVNEFIRNSGGVFDAVVDFDAAVGDPNKKDQLAAKYDGGDHLHPNVAGFQAMADAFPVEVFAKVPPKPLV